MRQSSKTQPPLFGKSVLLVVSGGIAAYKSLDLVRRLKENGARVRVVLTSAGAQFVTPFALATLSEEPVFSDLFSLKDEVEIGHIRLTREADLVVIAPASADILAKMAQGHASDLASTVLLASDKDTLAAPAMNHRMWDHPATQANITTLKERGVAFVGPRKGAMACGEYGMGRMAEPQDILAAIRGYFETGSAHPDHPLQGLKALVTAGPTFEPIDPVRYLGNRSSGKQGYAIAAALRLAGVDVTLISGPSTENPPAGVALIQVETARQMHAAAMSRLPVDIAVCTAAVADWGVEQVADHKLKKNGKAPPDLRLIPNPDVLQSIASATNQRPKLVIGFAAESENVLDHARQKRIVKKCDWILANSIAQGTQTFGGADNTVTLITQSEEESWPQMSKKAIARQLIERIAGFFQKEA